jgi:uncharacterized membrane protein YfcA
MYHGMRPTLYELAVGFGTNFFDALGIGSYATTTAAFKARDVVADEHIPGTLNVGHLPPTIAEAFIYITAINVETVTLVALIAGATAGAWIGAGVVSRWPRRAVQRGMAIALVLTAAFMILRQVGLFPPGGDAIGLPAGRLAIGVVGNALFGALMTLGVGMYAPCMGMVTLLGMSPATAFPIMMGSCAFLMPVASYRFIRAGAYDRQASLGLAIGGVPGVLVAAFLVKSLPLGALRWMVVAVILYTAVIMWRSSLAVPSSRAAVGIPSQL